MTTIYIIERAGEPVALADAAGQADARRLYLESLGVTARIASARDVLALRTLPVLARGEAVALPRAAISDLFDGSDAHLLPADLAVIEATHCPPVEIAPLAAGGFSPCGRALGDCGKGRQTCGRDGCGAEVVEMPPQHAPIAAVLEGLASGEPAEPVALDASAPAGVAPDYSVSAAADAPADDAAPTLAERMASAYAAGVEIARQGRSRWSVEFLDANAVALRGLRGDDADAVHAEMLRGFEGARPESSKPELKRQAEAAAARAGGKIVAKYRDPATGQTWTGRGMKPRWLVAAIGEGRTLDEFLITA